MLRVIFLLVCGLTFALQQNQNFRAGNITACFEQGFCNLTTGCCSGNGMCVYNTTSGQASCTCDSPKECRPGLKNVSSYSGPQCQTHPGDCCTNGTDDLSFSNNGGCHLQNSTILYPAVDNSTNLYPEAGARGSLLVRTGNATYGDGVRSIFSWSKSIATMVTNLTDPSRGIANTSGNMLGLGFLEFAIKDIVDYEYDSSNNVTFYNVTYPTLKCQNNTGITINTSFALNYKIPCQFANNASGVIDLGPLYDYAHRIPIPAATNSSQLGPYLDLTDAFAHWNATHHMPYEFMVALRYYAQYHYLAARNFEEFFCGQNSTVAAINLATCTIRNSTNANGVKYFGCDQDLRDWIFQQARRSTIRFSQAMLQMSVLSIALEYYDPQLHRSGYDGKFDTIFQMWWNGDGPLVDWTGTYNLNVPQPSVRQHQEWNNTAIQTRLAHTVQAGLNTLISLRNTDYNTSTADYLLNAPYNCDGYVTSSFAKEVVRLSRTPLHRYGSQIAKCFQADVAIELHRAGQLGLDYQTQVKGLTNAPNVTDLGTNPINFLFGTLTETNSTRQYYNTIASTALASIVEIHYVTAPNADRTGYYHYNSSYLADGNRFHPDPRFVTIPAYDFLNMWNCPVGASNCNQDISRNAAPFVLGYDPRMDPNEDDDPFGPMEDDARWRSQGLTYNGPSLYFQPQNGANTPTSGGFNYRLFPQWQLNADFLNVLFYQWDGLTTLAVKNAVAWGDSIYRYLPNPIVDSIPTNIGWLDVNFDGLCYDPYYMETSVGCRYNASLSLCTWNWQWQ